MILAFFIECECPPDRRAATVGGGDFASVEEFLESYQLTHIECWSCRNHYRLIGYMDETGVERAVSLDVAAAPRPRRRRVSLARTTR